MKKTRSDSRPPVTETELLPEYRFDYRKARPNRFATRVKPGARAIILDPDVAEVFTTPGLGQRHTPRLDTNHAAKSFELEPRPPVACPADVPSRMAQIVHLRTPSLLPLSVGLP